MTIKANNAERTQRAGQNPGGTHARYIGRVGALAVALGIGAAVAGSPGLAWATPDTTSPVENPGAGTVNVDTPPPNGAIEPAPAALPAPKRAVNHATDPTDPKNPEPDPKSQSTTSIKQGSSPAVTVSGSGGLNTTVGNDSSPSAAPESGEPEVPDASATPSLNRSSVTNKDNPRQPANSTATPTDPITAVASAINTTKVDITKTVIGIAAPATTANLTPAATPISSARAAAPTIGAAEIVETTPLAPDTASQRPGIAAVVTQLVATVLSPFLNPSPHTPAAPVFALTVLAWVRREINTATEQFATPPIDQTLTSQTVTPMALARAAAPTTLAAAAAPPPPSGLLPTVAAVVAGVGNVVGGIVGFLGGIIGGVFNQPPTASPTFTNIDNYGVVTGKLNASDPNGDAMTYQVTTQATKGTTTVDAAGTFIYTPTPVARAQAAATPGPDVDTFTITITDARGAKTTVAINNAPITPNRAPINGAFTVTNTNPSTGVITGTASATDQDGDSLTFSGPTSTPKAVVTVNSTTGVVTYAPTPAALHAAAAGAAAPESFNIVVSDGHGGTLNVPVSLTIPSSAATNQNPAGGTFTVTNTNPTNGVITGTITGVTDPDGDTLTYTAPASTPKAVVTVNSTTGALTYSPTPAGLHAGGTETFNVTVTDGHGGTLNVPVSLTIPSSATTNQNPINGAFTVTSTDPATGVITGTVSATDPDGDTLSFAGPTSTPKANVTVTPAGAVTYVPTPAALHTGGTDTFNVTVTDGHGGTLNVPVSVTIAAANRPPVVSALATVSAPDPTTASVSGSVHVVDPDNDPLTYTVTQAPTRGTFTITPNGGFTYTPDLAARISATNVPNATYLRSDSLAFTVSDGHGGTTVATVDLPVTPAPDPTVAMIPVGNAPSSVTVTPDGSHAYVTNVMDNSVSVIDTNTNTVVTTITSVGNQPQSAAVTPNGTRLYVTNTLDNSVTVINTGTNAVTNTISLSNRPLGIAITPDGTRAYVTLNAAKVAVIDTTTNTVISTIPVGTGPNGVAISPDGTRVYVSNGFGDTVSVINTANNSVTATIPVGAAPGVIMFSPNGTRAYVSNFGRSFGNDSVSVIDTTNNTVIATIPVGDQPRGMAISHDGTRIYVVNQTAANQTGGSLSVIDTSNNTVIATLPAGLNPFGIGISHDGTLGYIAQFDSAGTVRVISLT
jgi:YVTN family beta-propeller protein/VCBS repeat-containing protein